MIDLGSPELKPFSDVIEIELPAPDSLPEVIVGSIVTDGADRRGRIGILAVTSQLDIVGLTAATVCECGKEATILTSHGHITFEGVSYLRDEIEPESPIGALVCAIPLLGALRLRSEFAGLDAALRPVEPTAECRRAFLHRGAERIALGSTVATHATVYRDVGGVRKIYHGAVQIDACGVGFLRGDAGSAVCNEFGEPIGLLVGVQGQLAIVAPLAPLLRAAGMTPLSTFEASRQFVRALRANEKSYIEQLISAEQNSITTRTDFTYQDNMIRSSKDQFAAFFAERKVA